MKRAFSLVELLIVVAIMLVLAVLAIPAISSIGRASSLSTAAQSVAGTLDLARQTAISQNRTIEVRLYKMPEDGQPTATPSGYRSLQLFLVDYDTTNAFSKPLTFTGPTIFSDNVAASSLMNDTNLPEKPAPSGVTVSPVGANYRYRSFYFKPDGTANLSFSTNWSLAVVNKNDPIKSNSLPANYAKVTIEPMTGKIKIERP